MILITEIVDLAVCEIIKIMDNMVLNKNRKENRLKEYDYSLPRAYFITICTQNRVNYFWNNVGARNARPTDYTLTEYGITVEKAINAISNHYPAVTVDNYVIMPDHIHLLLKIHTDSEGRALRAPTIGTIVNQFKGYVTKQLKTSIWQKLFFDHIVRSQQDYKEIWKYIDNNPLNLKDDHFNSEVKK